MIDYITTNSILELFCNAMRDKSTPPPSPCEIIADGKIHRFHTQGDKSGTKNGWYALFGNAIPCGVFGNWKEGSTHKWSAKKPIHMGLKERIQYMKQLEFAKNQRKIARENEQKLAATLAEKKYYSSPAANPKHPYLTRKLIKPFYARRRGSYLLLPIIDFDGNLWSLQHIAPNGEKRFWPNGAIEKHFIPIQHRPAKGRRILICEGFATGATLADACPNDSVIAACNAGNLISVSMEIRKNLPEARIIICADTDKIGLAKAKEAALAAKALVKTPEFPHNSCQKLTDFNDLFCWLRGVIS